MIPMCQVCGSPLPVDTHSRPAHAKDKPIPTFNISANVCPCRMSKAEVKAQIRYLDHMFENWLTTHEISPRLIEKAKRGSVYHRAYTRYKKQISRLERQLSSQSRQDL